MSGSFFSDDGQPTDLDPFAERQMGERLRSVLQDHADHIEPAPNSYLTLSKRLEEAVPASPKRPGRGGARFLAAAAMLIAVAGAGSVLMTQLQNDDVNAIGSDGSEEQPIPVVTTATTTTTVTPTTQITTTTTVAPTTTTSPSPEVAAAVVDEVDVPRSVDERSAAANLVYTLGVPGAARYESDGSQVNVFVPEDIDTGQGPLTEIAVAGDAEKGFVATGATSETMQISDVYVDGGELVVLGQGIAFEASVEVYLIGTDGTRLASTFTRAGCCEELVPFEARLPVRGVGEAFLLVHGDYAGSGVVPAFAAVPISFVGSADPTSYTVFRIRPEDEDRGLNLRDLPGSDEGQVLETLSPGSTGITRLPTVPALVGDSFWWNVQTAEGNNGWVHSSFLTPDASDLSDEDLLVWADSAVANLGFIEFEGLDLLGMSRRVPVALGWLGDPRIVSAPAEMLDEDFWVKARTWSVPEATFGESEKVISLRSLLTANLEPAGERQIEVGARVLYGFEQEMVSGYFAGTRAVTVIGPDADNPEDRRSMILFYEAGPTRPELVGVVSSIFVP